MTFNWFNRKLDDQPEPEPLPESAVAVPEAQAAESPPIAEDYLSFAKAAYENLKKKQAAAAQAAAVPVVEPVVAAELVEELVIEPVAVPVAELITEPELVAESVAELVAAPELAGTVMSSAVTRGELAPALDTMAAPVEAEPAAPAPFWAQSIAEREARLERLRETAIGIDALTPSGPPPTPSLDRTEAPTDLVLDEGFLWSTDVLAAQGRRVEDVTLEEITWLRRLRQGLDKTRRNLINQLKAIVGQGPLNQDAVMEIEALLLQADAGVEATDAIINALQEKLRQEVLPPDQAIAYLKQLLRDLLDRPLQTTYNAAFYPEKAKLNIWLITGVNGAGKTTTIGKLAHIAQKSGYSCLIAAADTFRAAAVEQVKVWGQRSNVEVIANPGQNTDPAAVVFDGIAAAQARNIELLLVDTAGRLQNKKNLMDELSKIRRIIDKKAPQATVESLLVLDATLGQNGLRQARVFSEAAQLSGVVLTKLDSTAKGGVALAVVQELGLPIRFIGAGEGIEDLRPFSSYEFVEALISG
jgi:fused signal recognition particle receptor